MEKNRLPKDGVARWIGELMSGVSREPAWNVECRNSGRENKWNYVDGCMMLAFGELYKITGNEDLFSYVKLFADDFVAEDGSIRTYDADSFCLDNINEGKILFPLLDQTGQPKYLNAIEAVYRNLREMPRTPSGSFWHKKIYPNQVWLDGLFMAMPFYMQYETRYHHMRNYQDVVSQFLRVRERMQDEKTGLYYHGFDESRSADWADQETGLSKSFWLRAVGWLVMALTDTLEQMDEQIYYEYRSLCTMLKELADALMPFQHESGMFHQVIDRPQDEGNYLETSGTCMISAGILKAVRLHLLPESYAAFAERAFYGTVKRYFSEGGAHPKLGGICLVGGLGGPAKRDGTPGYYYGEPVVENDGKGAAPFLLAYGELLRRSPDAVSGPRCIPNFAGGTLE